MDVSEVVQRLRANTEACAEQDTESELYVMLSHIYNQFMTYNEKFVPRANAFVEAGIVDELYRIARTSPDHRAQVKALYILGMLCFNNLPVTNYVARHPHMTSLLLRATNPSNPPTILKSALYLMCNLTANSFDTHPAILDLLPHVRTVLTMEDMLHPIRSEAVRVCFYLSANDANAERLRASGILAPLVAVMASRSVSLDCTSAGITVANLVGADHSPEALAAMADCAWSLVQCFEACLNGTDYPVGSNLFYRNWKVAKGLHNLSLSPTIADGLVQAGIVPLLNRALQGDDTDGCMHAFSLKMLWSVADHCVKDDMEM